MDVYGIGKGVKIKESRQGDNQIVRVISLDLSKLKQRQMVNEQNGMEI